MKFIKTKLEDINKEELKFINGGTVKDSKKKDSGRKDTSKGDNCDLPLDHPDLEV
jgi:hypothetical protein